MQLLTELTSDYKQKYSITTEDNETFDLLLEYMTQQQCWYYSISYGDNFVINNQRLVYSPNILRQYKNIIPFGLAVNTLDQSDPYFLEDFESGRVEVTVLTESEVEQIEAQIFT